MLHARFGPDPYVWPFYVLGLGLLTAVAFVALLFGGVQLSLGQSPTALVVVPGAAPRRIEASRSHVDLAPTLLELFGLPPEPEFTGHSLVPELRGAAPEARDVWVDLARTGNNDRRRGLIHGQYKLTAYGDDGRFDLYDIEADPGELTNLARTQPEVYRDMVRRYREAQPGIRNEHVYGCRTLTGAPPGRGW